MLIRQIKSVALALSVLAAVVVSPARGQDVDPMVSREADIALAQRFAEWAQGTLRLKVTVGPMWKQAAALLEAAARLSENDPRYYRFLAEAQMQAGNVDGAINALTRCNSLDPTDQGVQIQLIDLHASRIETAEKKLKYLRDDILGNPAIAQEVRSYAAVNAARMAEERGQMQEAASLLGQSLRLNPLNLPALRMRMEWLTYSGTPLERMTTLLMMMRSNPAQVGVIVRIADELAAVGAVEESLSWYNTAINMLPRMGMGVPRDVVLKYATELAIAEQYEVADNLLGQLLSLDSNDVEAWMVRLVAVRRLDDKTHVEKVQAMARNALMNRLNSVRIALGNTTATTRPVESEGTIDLPDLADDVKKLQESGTEIQKAAFVTAAQDLAWYELFIQKSPLDAKRLIDALRPLLPDDSLTLARLEGWDFLVQDKKDEAKVKLSAVADHDPLAAMGMIRMAADDAKSQQEADSIGRRLVTETPSGLLGLILRDGLRDRANVRFVPTPITDAVRQELAQFPAAWMQVLDNPKAFYAIRAEPLKVGTLYHEPMFARVTIQNISNFDLTIGREGVLKPDLWFDATLKGVVQQQVGAAAYDRLTHLMILPARSSTSQIVRMDQNDLLRGMQSNPGVTLQVQASIITNPVFTQQGVLPGMGGDRVQFVRMFVRTAMPMNNQQDRQRIMDNANSGTASIRMLNLEALAVYAQFLAAGKDANDETRQLAGAFVNVIRTACNDPVPSISALAWFLTTSYNGDVDGKAAMIKDMLDNPQWQRRMVGLITLRSLPPQKQVELIGNLPETDPDPVVGRFAEGVLEFAKLATTQPAVEHEAAPSPAVGPGEGNGIIPDLGNLTAPMGETSP